MLLVWALVVLLAAPLAVTLTSALSGAGWEAQGSTAQEVRDELRRDFPQLGAEAAIVAYRQETPIAEDPAGLRTLVAGLQGSPGTTAVIDPLAQPADAGLLSRDGRAALVPVDLASQTDADLPESAGELMATVDAIDLPEDAEADATGEWAVWHDFNELNEQALHKAELLSGLPTVILLFIAFGSAIAAGLPLLLAVAGIAVGFALLHLGTGVTPLSVWSMNFSMMIGLAVGIDYSLFIVSRYREEREDGKAALDAIAATLATAGKAVFLSALTVVLSLAAIFLVPVMVFRSMAFGMILSVVATAAASLTLLPAVLVALGDRVLVSKGRNDPDRAAEGRWARWTAGGDAPARRHPRRRTRAAAPARGTRPRHAARDARRRRRRPWPPEPRRLRRRRRALRRRRPGPHVRHRAHRPGRRGRRLRRRRPGRGRRPRGGRAGRLRTHRRADHPGHHRRLPGHLGPGPPVA